MKASELVAKLEALAKVYGDLDVLVFDGHDERVPKLEYNTDMEDPVFLITLEESPMKLVCNFLGCFRRLEQRVVAQVRFEEDCGTTSYKLEECGHWVM